MKKLLLGSIPPLVALMTGAASAADFPLASPAYVAPWSWTGVYVGGNLGYSVGRDPTIQTAAPLGMSGTVVAGSFNQAPAGLLSGGQVGFNWQFVPQWVLGFEADWQWTGQTDSTCVLTRCPAGFAINLDQSLKWFGTARARLGYAQDRWLWYVTGGAAWGRIDNNFSFTINNPINSLTSGIRASHDNGGWVVGGGVETALSSNWSAKLEYLYMSLGSVADSFAVTLPGAPPITFATTSDIRDHIVRVGVNYRLGGPPVADGAVGAPVYKAPIAAPSWTGFYVGGNVGYSIGRNPTTETLTQGGVPPVVSTVGAFEQVPAGVVGGGQIGFNWQAASNWVLGFEADWQATGQKDTSCVDQCAVSSAFGVLAVTLDQSLKWVATARTRLGYAHDQWLWYLTAGPAWGRIDNNFGFATSGFIATINPGGTMTFSHNNFGVALGGGVETALSANWSAKIEYLYVSLGGVADSLTVAGVLPLTVTTASDIRDHIVRFGVNYRFGGPVVANY